MKVTSQQVYDIFGTRMFSRSELAHALKLKGRDIISITRVRCNGHAGGLFSLNETGLKEVTCRALAS